MCERKRIEREAREKMRKGRNVSHLQDTDKLR